MNSIPTRVLDCLLSIAAFCQFLGALAHPLSSVVSQTAAQCLRMWEQASTGSAHLQSQRFLSPDFAGTLADPSLRPAVEMLAAGQKVYQLPTELRDPLWKWLSAFRLVRTVERSVEGAHSLVSRALKRAPAAKLPYLSVEVRFSLMKPMLRELALNPQAGLFCNSA